MPAYILSDVKKSASKQQIDYRGNRVSVDVQELGYQLDVVIDCIMKLQQTDFHKSITNPDGSVDDAYITSFPRPDGNGGTDELYIKFCLLNDGKIDLASFHLSR